MAEHQESFLIDKDLRPACYDDFHCLMSECRYSCCKVSWRITFNKKDYLALKRQNGSPDLEARMERALRRVRKDLPAEHYGEFDMHSGECPLLREDCLCALQVEKGHEVLPKVCQTFPRAESYTPGYLEKSLTPACEGVLDLLWNLPEGLEFRSEPLPKELQRTLHLQEQGLHLMYFPLIREWCVDVLQDRRFPLPDRLLLLGLGLRRLADGEKDYAAWLLWARALPESAEHLLDREADEHTLARFLSNNIQVLIELNVPGPDFSELKSDLLRSLNLTINRETNRTTIPLAPYQEARKRWESRIGERGYFMENLMVMLALHLYFPDLTSPKALWKSYANLCSLYSVYRFMEVMSCREGAACDKAELFRLIVYTSRGLIHNNSFQNKLRDELFQHDSATLAHMAILLSG